MIPTTIAIMILLMIPGFVSPLPAAAYKQESAQTDALPEEKDVLRALEKVRVNVESDAEFGRYSELVEAAGVNLNMLKRVSRKNQFFYYYVHSSYVAYQNARMLWKSKLKFGEGATRDESIQLEWKRAARSLDMAHQFIR